MADYIGIDVGTTNIKALLLNSQGIVTRIISKPTPYLKKDGARYFDMNEIEKITDCMIDCLESDSHVSALAFSSVGESFVPVKNGMMVSDPLLWSEMTTESTWRKHRQKLTQMAPYSVTGLKDSMYYSVYKIMWMNSIFEETRSADFWLPINSYLAYRKTNQRVVDFSQGCRTGLIDIHSRVWNSELMEKFSICGGICDNELKYTGEEIGCTKDGKKVFTGGHDHIAGLFGTTLLAESNNLFYDSMGTAGVLAMLRDEKQEEMHLSEPFCESGYLGIGFKEKQYYTLNTVHHYGKVLEWIMKSFMPGNSISDFREINSKIRFDRDSEIYLTVQGNPLSPSWQRGMGISGDFYDHTPEEIMLNGYLYLSYLSKYLLEELENHFIIENEIPYIAGGGITQNEMFMKIKATTLGRKITILPTTQITALGTALAAAYGMDDHSTVYGCSKNMQMKTINPDEDLDEFIKSKISLMETFYKNWR